VKDAGDGAVEDRAFRNRILASDVGQIAYDSGLECAFGKLLRDPKQE